MQVVRDGEHGIVCKVRLLDGAGNEVVPVTQFLSHLFDSNYSPNTVCAYGYDLRHLMTFLDEQGIGWNDFYPSTALEFLAYLRRVPSQRPAQRLGLTVATEGGRLLSAATVQRVLAATSSLFEWAIAAGLYTAGENPMLRRVDHALGRVPDRHQPFVGAASRQQPVRRTVRVRLPLRLPRPMSTEDIDALLASLTTLRDLAIFLLMLDGGLRPGEVLCLQLGDVSYGRRRLTIRNAMTIPAAPEPRPDTNALSTCTSRARWTRLTATCCTNARSTPIARSCSWLVDPGAGATIRSAIRPSHVASPDAWTGWVFEHPTRRRMHCDTRTLLRCGRAECASWPCRNDWATPRRSRSASTQGFPTSRYSPTTIARCSRGHDRHCSVVAGVDTRRCPT